MAPPLLTQFWVREAYRQVCDMGRWSWLRSESEFLINDSKAAGTVTVTRNSATVVGSGTAFAATDVGRQFRVGSNQPIYSIQTFTSATSIALDRPYGGTTAAGQAYRILDAYVTVPVDFQAFIAVLDTQNNWQLHLWMTEEELNVRDAQRSASGTPWALASRRLSSLAATVGRAQYELWPYATTEKNYPFYYVRRPEALVDATAFLGPLADNADILVAGALAQAAAWPGTEDRKNPYFNPTLAASKRKEFDDKRNRLEVLDQELYPTWLETVSWLNRFPFAPIDSKYLQSHDVNMGMLYGPTWIH